jgi:hypothetical protein
VRLHSQNQDIYRSFYKAKQLNTTLKTKNKTKNRQTLKPSIHRTAATVHPAAAAISSASSLLPLVLPNSMHIQYSAEIDARFRLLWRVHKQ